MFSVEFEEENPVQLLLRYGSVGDMRIEELNLANCTQINKKKTCTTSVNLGEFENQEIEYYFELMDLVNNTIVSRARAVSVDTTRPEIEAFSYLVEGRRVNFFMEINEQNFKKVVYIDYEDETPRERTLCSRLDEGICAASKTFNRREHNLTIKTFDEAGNEAVVMENLIFVVD